MDKSTANALPITSNSASIEEILKQHDEYILALARKKVSRTSVRHEVLDLEVDELAQNSRIKLWLTLQKRQIINIKAYIRCIVHTEAINLIRQHKKTLTLIEDDDNELSQGTLMIIPGEGMQDPSLELEQKELVNEYISKTAAAVVTLPSHQQKAMICSLKDQIDDLLQFSGIFRNYKTEIEKVNWPEEKINRQRLKASLSAARKKLRPMISESALPAQAVEK